MRATGWQTVRPMWAGERLHPKRFTVPHESDGRNVRPGAAGVPSTCSKRSKRRPVPKSGRAYRSSRPVDRAPADRPARPQIAGRGRCAVSQWLAAGPRGTLTVLRVGRRPRRRCRCRAGRPRGVAARRLRPAPASASHPPGCANRGIRLQRRRPRWGEAPSRRGSPTVARGDSAPARRSPRESLRPSESRRPSPADRWEAPDVEGPWGGWTREAVVASLRGRNAPTTGWPFQPFTAECTATAFRRSTPPTDDEGVTALPVVAGSAVAGIDRHVE